MPLVRRAGTAFEITNSTGSVVLGTAADEAAPGDKLPGTYAVDTTGAVANQALYFNGTQFGVAATAAVQTTDATVTTAATHTPADASVVVLRVTVAARRTDGLAAGGYARQGTFRRAGGTTTQVGATSTLGTDAEDSAAWDVALDTSGSAVRVRVTGEAGKTINWSVRVELVAVAT